MQVSLKDKIAPPFYPVHNAIRKGTHTEFWLKGGRASTKSSFTAIEIISGVIADPEANAACFRKVSDTIRDSLHPQLMWAADELGVSKYFKATTSPFEMIYIPTGQQIIMRGLDDPKKRKGIKPKKGRFKYLWFEELDEFTGMDEIRNVEQSVMRGDGEFIEFLTYNPPRDNNSWVNVESIQASAKRFIHHSTYLDVPKEWLGQAWLGKADLLKARDYERYRHEYLGDIIGRSEALVFYGKWRVDDFDTPQDAEHRFGCDWGFANDPTTLIRCHISDDGRNLFIDQELRQVGLELDDTADAFKTIEGAKRYRIRADCARPESISYVRRNGGLDIVPTQKGAGSVEDGLAFLRSFDSIVIHPRCVHTIAEFKTYSYKTDRYTHEVLPDIAKNQDDHMIDALRYALEPLMKKTGGGFITI